MLKKWVLKIRERIHVTFLNPLNQDSRISGIYFLITLKPSPFKPFKLVNKQVSSLVLKFEGSVLPNKLQHKENNHTSYGNI